MIRRGLIAVLLSGVCSVAFADQNSGAASGSTSLSPGGFHAAMATGLGTAAVDVAMGVAIAGVAIGATTGGGPGTTTVTTTTITKKP